MSCAALPASGAVSVSVAAPPEAVWAFVCDPSVPARFSDELYEASFDDGAGVSVGAVIVGHNRNGEFTWTTSSIVTDCVAPSTFRWATGAPGAPAATWTLSIRPVDGGATLTHEVVFHEGRAPLAPAIEAEPDRAHEIVGTRLEKVLASMTATVTGIAGLAELEHRKG
jgi:uncharacterized protein YndB with AHSA1/START domain